MTVEWRLAVPADARLLQSFTCTDPPRPLLGRRHGRKYHHAPWEEEAQKWLRENGARLLGQQPVDRRTLLGLDGSTLVAVTCHQRAADLERVVGSPVRMLMATGVDLSRRGDGLGVRAHDRALQDALATQGGALVVVGGVHPQNEASKRCLKKSGFERRPSIEELLPGEYEVWAVEVRP